MLLFSRRLYVLIGVGIFFVLDASIVFAAPIPSACPILNSPIALHQGVVSPNVYFLQKLLNLDSATRVAATGPGSPGKESTYFGPATATAVSRFQEKYAKDILTPSGLSRGTGTLGPATRKKLSALYCGTGVAAPTPATPVKTSATTTSPTTPAPQQPNLTGITGTLSLLAPSCTISLGYRACALSVSWTVSNPVKPAFTQDGVRLASTYNGLYSATVSYGSSTFALLDGTTVLDTKVANAVCAGGNSWNGSACIVGTTPIASTTPITGTNGVCGGANGSTVSSAPSSNLCTTGNSTGVVGSGPWTWSCLGTGSGSSASCRASVTAPTPGAAPKTFWASYPIRPDETALLRGDGYPSGLTMLVDQLANTSPGDPLQRPSDPTLSKEIAPVQSTANSASFTIPRSLPFGVFGYKLASPTTSLGSLGLLNVPDLWFAMADGGRSASPGGWIELYGRSIALSGALQPRIMLVSSGGAEYTGTLINTNNTYSARFSIPANIPEGTYSLYEHNGYGGGYGWSKYEWHGDTVITTIDVRRLSAWPTDVYDVDSMMGSTTDDQVSAALALAKQNGGGVIHFSAGSYTLTQPLVMPNHTILRGDGKDSTSLQWVGKVIDSRTGGAEACAGLNGVTALVTSDYVTWNGDGPLCASFSVEDITLGHATSDDYICIKRAYTGDERAWFTRMACVSPNRAGDTESGKGLGMWMARTTATTISDSLFDYRTGIDLHGDRAVNTFVRIERNTFRWRFAPYIVYFRNNGLVIANNQIVMAGNEVLNGTANDADVGEAFGTFGSNIRDVYVGNNVSRREDGSPVPNNSQVDMTFDGSAGAYFGKVASASGTTINLAGVTAGPDTYGRPPVAQGGIVQIIAGKGAGQIRTLMSPSTSVSSVTIDSPWDVVPDSTSWINISDYQGRYLFVGNTFTNHPRVQFYFPTSDVIVANNTFGVNGPSTILNLWAAPRWNGFSTGMYYQVLDNTITRGGLHQITIINALETPPGNYPGYSALSQIFRNNSSDGAPFVMETGRSLDGLIIEKNTGLSNITFSRPTSSAGVMIRANTTSSGGATPVSSDGSVGTSP